MNEILKKLTDLIQKSETLKDNERTTLLEELKAAEKDFEITAFKLERTEKVKKTTAILLEETIEELEQKRKAVESQNRELEIEAALERVRTSAMSMNKPSDLLSVAEIQFTEFKTLGFNNIRNALIAILNDEEKFFLDHTYSDQTGGSINKVFYDSHPVINNFINQIKKAKVDFMEFIINKNQLDGWKEFIRSHGGQDAATLNNIDVLYYYNYSIEFGAIGISTYSPVSKEQLVILKRFRNVFDIAYRRYNDIVLAEAQTKEAQIEAALEKVRSSALAMTEPADMVEVCRIVSEQLQLLGINDIRNVQTVVIYEQKGTYLNYQYFTAYKKSAIEEAEYKKHPSAYRMAQEMKKSGEAFYSESFSGEDLNVFREYRNSDKQFPDPIMDKTTSVHFYFFSIGMGALGISTYDKELSENDVNLFKRFRNVFELAYRRFVDIETALAQAREAQIEAALERVRSRTMAMQQSNELAETAADFFVQLNNLGIKPYRCSIAIVDEQDEKLQLWSTTNEGKVIPIGTFIPFSENDVFIQMYEGWKEQQHRIIKITGQARIIWTEYIRKYVPFAEYMPENIDIEKLKSEAAILSNFYFKQGFFVIHTSVEIDDSDLKILQRFANVFEQTYTRFLDLKKAEAQAKEAIKQASMDRVRAEIASMRTADDLNRITPIIWHELKAMEIPFIRCGLYIIDEQQEKVQVYLTTPDGKALGVLNLDFDVNEMTRNTVDHWRKEKVFKEFWDRQGFINWTNSMIELGQVQDAETYQGSANPPESLHLHFVPFSQGMLYVGAVSPLTEDKLELVKSLAEAFSIAYARYEDFRNLEDAKNRIEITLSELKSTQAQLVHAEKMASLGELTAGIAHEIKNPLNFVNNFSEVSRELLDEMKIEIQNNNIEDVIEMVEDLKQNLEKINHHGKRADLIIKSMLLHSRGSSGEKVPANINELLDQYVVLSYHGMRAQNKDFNITIEKIYDETIPKINVVPQDISRVFLNIVNNACYATHEKKKNDGDSYSPLLQVATKNLKDKIEIKIKDNGNGIPSAVKDNIFNPFFTTKPTGEGTGLGLSLSYDIVTKVHGGEIKFESEEGQFTEFKIILPKQKPE